ncbi:helix-turn-helix domain-containing protein [Leptospira ryugenii]|nr:helix-turn-helix domain-containing protein [Leptospira ryugenii]
MKKFFSTSLVSILILLSLNRTLLAESIPEKSVDRGPLLLQPSPEPQKVDRGAVLQAGFREEPVHFVLALPEVISESQSKYLVFLWSHLDWVQVCAESEPCQSAGYSLPLGLWPLPQIFPVFPISLKQKETKVQIEIRSRNYIETEIQILSLQELLQTISYFTGLIFSFLCIITAFFIRILFFYLKDPKPWILSNVLFHLGILFIFLFGSGLGNLYLFPNSVIPLSLFKKLSVGYLILTGTNWIRTYMDLSLDFPKSNRFMIFCQIAAVILMVSSFFPIPRQYIAISYTFLYVSITILALIIAFVKLEDSLKQTPWFILSILCLLLFEILNLFSYESFDSHDGKIYLFFLSIFLPANAYFISQAIQVKLQEIEQTETVSARLITRLKTDITSSNQQETQTKKSHLIGINTEKKIEELKNLFQSEKIHLDEELRLSDLSALLKLNAHQTSELINQIMGISFADLIKQYRIEDAKEKLIKEKDKSILDIALDCGFTSKSVFNDAFKNQVGLPPSQFRKQSLKKESD